MSERRRRHVSTGGFVIDRLLDDDAPLAVRRDVLALLQRQLDTLRADGELGDVGDARDVGAFRRPTADVDDTDAVRRL